ncbi:MAG: class II aldolase/adducin family protein [Methanocellales archaeon]|nr:class II aldolase/adducin family protein [Methanocellales archaeon]
MLKEMAKFGEKLVRDGLVKSHFGNISVRIDNKMLITKRGAMLDNISKDSVVEIDIEEPKSFDMVASMEAKVHKAVYQRTSALAIIHAHPIYAVVESLILSQDKITPVDCEGLYYLREIPIIEGKRQVQKNLPMMYPVCFGITRAL